MRRINSLSPASDTWRVCSAVSRAELGPLYSGLIWVLLVLALPAPSFAGSDHDGELGRWVYSGALEMGVFAHTGKGRMDSTEITGPRVSNPRIGMDGPLQLLPFSRSREEVLSMLVGGTFEVMTPELLSSLGHPRLFLDVNISNPFTKEVGLGREGDPSKLRFPDPYDSSFIQGEDAIEGRGGQVAVQHQGPQIHAGFGSAFTLDVGADRIRIKPSLVYSRIITDVYAIGNRASRLTNSIDPNRTFEDTYRTISLQESRREVYHGAGPALEIEYETGERLGPFMMTVFIKGHASHLFGDLKTRLEQSNPAYPDEKFFWKYSQDRWVYRASTGLRFRWVPK